jgi:hypothetical protein
MKIAIAEDSEKPKCSSSLEVGRAILLCKLPPEHDGNHLDGYGAEWKY